MSSSVPIPLRKRDASAQATSYSSSSASSSYSSPPGGGLPRPMSSKGKEPVSPSSSLPAADRISPRRPSLLGSSLAMAEHTVVNLGHEDGPPRLVTCVKSSQGFDWNQELFLPSYIHLDSNDLEHRQDPVEEIVLSDEEAAAMLPQ